MYAEHGITHIHDGGLFTPIQKSLSTIPFIYATQLTYRQYSLLYMTVKTFARIHVKCSIAIHYCFVHVFLDHLHNYLKYYSTPRIMWLELHCV